VFVGRERVAFRADHRRGNLEPAQRLHKPRHGLLLLLLLLFESVISESVTEMLSWRTKTRRSRTPELDTDAFLANVDTSFGVRSSWLAPCSCRYRPRCPSRIELALLSQSEGVVSAGGHCDKPPPRLHQGFDPPSSTSILSSEPWPSAPYVPSPKEKTAPASVTAKVKQRPSATPTMQSCENAGLGLG
jgi:hypothetical protein